MPVSVPTDDEFEALLQTVADLDARVTALEEGSVTPPDPIEPPDPPVVLTGLTAMITLGGEQYVFAQDDGVDLGDYEDPEGNFVQHCFCTTNARLPGFRVMFRPDADGTRDEVVFELGTIFDGTPAAHITEPYVATIARDEIVLATKTVPTHWWYARWRWFSKPRPVIHAVTDLIEHGLVPHYDARVGGGFTPPSQPHTYAGPMDLAGIYAYMPGTGDRDDIGLVTESQADYLCTQSDTALRTLLAWGEGSGTLSWHFRDENTGAPLDSHAYPNASCYDWHEPVTPFLPTNDWLPGSPVTLDCSHEPCLGYVPFLLTGDSYYLEELQFEVLYGVVSDSPGARGWYRLTGAVRAHAWVLRCMARGLKMTPESVPSWLLPRSYFQTLMDGNLAFVRSRMDSNTAPYVGLNLLGDAEGSSAEEHIPANCAISTWMEDFEVVVQGHVVELGFTEWRDVLEWKASQLVDRTSGHAGWMKGAAFPYKCAVRPAADQPYSEDWRDAWEVNATLGNVDANASNEHIAASDLAYYAPQGLGALAVCARLGVEGAVDCHNWLQSEVNRLVAPNATIYAKWSIA
jgi:hypothetical protein